MKGNKILYILIVFLSMSCYKEYKIENKSYYVMTGGIVNDYPPFFTLYKSDLFSTKELPYSEYDVIISDEMGNIDSMVNGLFINTIGVPGQLYLIKWKLKIDNTWNQFYKQMPSFNADVYSGYVENETYKVNSSDNYEYFLTYKSNNSDYFNLFKDGLFNPIDIGGSFFKLQKSINTLSIWPPANLEISNSDRKGVEYANYNCYKPFIWEKKFFKFGSKKDEYFLKDILSLYSMSKNDMQNLMNGNFNFAYQDQPLFIGESVNYDTKRSNQYAITYFITRYKDFNFDKVVDTSGSVDFEIKLNNKTIDLSKYEIGNIGFNVLDNENFKFNNIYKFYDLNKISGKLFNKDFVDYIFNKERLNNQCEIKPSYNIRVVVYFYERSNPKIRKTHFEYLNYDRSVNKIQINLID